MESRIYAGMNWSLSELTQLTDDKNSCVHFTRTKRHIAIHPFQLNDLNKALHEALRSLINFYDPELKGLLLAYKNPKLLSSLGSILYDSHFIHIDIEADFYVFKPEIGNVLNGIINKQATNHIGVLVHKAFNVSIPIHESDIVWQNYELNLGEKVEFTIAHLDFKGNLPFMRGKLISDFTRTVDEAVEPNFSPIKNNSQTVNGEDSDHRTDTINKKDTASKRINFLTSVLNQSSESSSDEEIVTKKKNTRETKSKTSNEMIKDNKKKVNCAVEDKNDVSSTSKAKHSIDDEDTSDEDIHAQSDRKKLKCHKTVTSSQSDENDEEKVTVKKRKKLQNDKSPSHEILSTPVTTVDRKPRIIHDRVLNGNERNIKIERTSVKISKKSSIFAHDLSDSDDDMDNGRNYLTQSSASVIIENNREEKVKKVHSNGRKSSDPVETNDESEEDEGKYEKSMMFIEKKSNKSKKKKLDLSDDNIDNKERIKNSILHSSTPDKITKSQEDSPKSKVTKEPVDNHVNIKSNVKEDNSNDSTGTSDMDNERRIEKRIKKKLKKLTPKQREDHISIDNSMPPPPSRPSAKIEKECSTTSPKKSRKSRDKSLESSDDSSDSMSPRKTKIKKHEEILFGNLKIKREPDASDVETSSSNKVERKHKHNIVNNSDTLAKVMVKPEPINVKTEEKNKGMKVKRKHKENRKNDSSVKCESDSSETERSFSVPKKKIKAMFSE